MHYVVKMTKVYVPTYVTSLWVGDLRRTLLYSVHVCATAGIASNGEGAGCDSGLLFLMEVEVGEELPHFHK